jgi:Rad/Gem-related GTP binding protein 1
VTSSNSSTERLTIIPVQASITISKNGYMRRSPEITPAARPFKVLILGGSSVGKTSLVSQFMTSEYLQAHDSNVDDETGEKSVSVLFEGEESELIFMDHPHSGIMPEICISSYDSNAFCVIYSTTDRNSFVLAENILQTLWTSERIEQKAVILVGNKADLARKRVISADEGKTMATTYDCKFIETSVTINHNVDELLVGILAQIRLKLENPEKSREILRKRSIATSDLSSMTISSKTSPRKYRGSKTSISFKVRGFFDRIWVREPETKSCQNLHVL